MNKTCRLVWNDMACHDTATWVGGPEGNWFDPANWAEGAVPDLADVAQVVIPEGTAVHFDPVAAVAPAAALAAVEIDGFTRHSGNRAPTSPMAGTDTVTPSRFPPPESMQSLARRPQPEPTGTLSQLVSGTGHS